MLGRMPREVLWTLTALLAVVAGWMDWRTRRIPNWLTVPALFMGITANSLAAGWGGLRTALLGAGLGLVLLLPFVVIRSLGAGDWKLVGAVGSFIGPQALITVLAITILMAGLMAVVLVVAKKRVGETAHNLWRMLGAMLTLHLPSSEVSFGVAVAIAVLLYTAQQFWAVA